ncbi:DUF6308 family protein [Rhodococcus pyridinivorans]|uniref:Uncharacterized protein n=1 Tax=Rhodococcus pyridinivorans TaxID=103816 RepID=A0A7M2XRZ4_9NOCA|nr:DUF6308 family protein [Rhodococcus pyridinivorans]QOW00163.1 hypothetical protein INP59_07385 [Rhodococcus pyridinivorans]WMM74063.1 DUF6308 family protein [Rhodococcus pyridinivorans]
MLTLPPALRHPDDDAAVDLLHQYYGKDDRGHTRTGVQWDTWDSTGTRLGDVDVFTADDLVAVTLLSVRASGRAARMLLVERREEFGALLAAVGPDRDLADEEDEMTPTSPVWQLEEALRTVPSVGRTTASKLIARKRPRLYPIYDTVVADVLRTERAYLEPTRSALRADGRRLHTRLLAIRDTAGLESTISAVRVLDMIAWMHGKNRRAHPPGSAEPR